MSKLANNRAYCSKLTAYPKRDGRAEKKKFFEEK
jgi:hypothetical protein